MTGSSIAVTFSGKIFNGDKLTLDIAEVPAFDMTEDVVVEDCHDEEAKTQIIDYATKH
ncbi:hypothetical protein GGI10_006201, partial [Coemansia sp. RSA 2530]